MAIHTDFKFHPQVTQIGCYWGGGGHSELYLLEGERLVLIDTGCVDTPEKYVSPVLEGMGLGLKDVGLVINTHGHFDHAGGNARVVAASGAEVWLPERDARIAEELDIQFEVLMAPDYRLIGREEEIPAALAKLKTEAEPTRIDRRLKDWELLDLGKGLEFRVVPCPGHSPGCVGFYWEREGMLFTGDGIPGAGSRPGGVPIIFDPDAYEATLDRVERLDLNVLCLGHHYFSLTGTRESVKFGRAGKQYVREARQVVAIIAEAVEAAAVEHPAASFPEMAAAALDRLTERLPVKRDPATGMPVAGGTSALNSYWERFKKRCVAEGV